MIEHFLEIVIFMGIVFISWRIFYLEVKHETLQTILRNMESNISSLKDKVESDAKTFLNSKSLRSDEQRLAAAIKRKEWWNKKRASKEPVAPVVTPEAQTPKT